MVENFFHQFFIRENYIKMLIQIICKNKYKKNGGNDKIHEFSTSYRKTSGKIK